jgi:predicted ATP-dependent serine protease
MDQAFTNLDAAFGGVSRGKVTEIYGPPGVGKTALWYATSHRVDMVTILTGNVVCSWPLVHCMLAKALSG